MLFDTDIPAFQVGLPMLAAIGVVLALLIFATISLALRIRKQQVTTGVERIVGQRGEALSEIGKNGQVRIGGEIWRAVASTTIDEGSMIRVTGVDGMTLSVEPIQQENEET